MMPYFEIAGEERKRLFSLKNNRREVLWEITGNCNQQCRYCYDTRTLGVQIDRQRAMDICQMIREHRWEHVHITGGETLLFPDLAEICDALSAQQVYLTTNLTLLGEREIAVLTKPNVVSIAVSLDALRPAVNDALRGNTVLVIEHLKRLLTLRKQGMITAQIRIHAVMTRYNLKDLFELLAWAKAIGIDEVSCQPVHLDLAHPCYGELSLTAEDLPEIRKIYALEKRLFASRYGNTHQELLEIYYENAQVRIWGCTKECICYIDSQGQLWNCPLKKRPWDGRQMLPAEEDVCSLSIQCMTCLKRLTWQDELSGSGAPLLP